MTEQQLLKLLKHSLDIMALKDQVMELQLEVFKLKNPEHTEMDLLTYHNELLKKRLDKNGTD